MICSGCMVSALPPTAAGAAAARLLTNASMPKEPYRRRRYTRDQPPRSHAVASQQLRAYPITSLLQVKAHLPRWIITMCHNHSRSRGDVRGQQNAVRLILHEREEDIQHLAARAIGSRPLVGSSSRADTWIVNGLLAMRQLDARMPRLKVLISRIVRRYNRSIASGTRHRDPNKDGCWQAPRQFLWRDSAR